MSVQRRRRGQSATVFRQQETRDNRGNKVILVDRENPIQVKAAFIPQRSSKAEVPGQVEIDLTKMIVAADLPDVGLWSRVVWRGTEWDVVAPPAYHHGTRHTRHWSIDIRERPNG